MVRISKQVHAAIDTVYGVVLIALPWITKANDDARFTGICVGAGAAVLVLGMLTDHGAALVRIVPMSLHLLFDVVLACFLIGLAVGIAVGDGRTEMWAPLLGLGIVGFVVVALTDVEPGPARGPAFAG